LRPGRVEIKVKVTRPDAEGCLALAKYYLANVPLRNTTVDDLSASLVDTMAATAMFNIRCADGNEYPVSLRDMASGAMIAGLVRRMKQRAIRRDIRLERSGAGLIAEDAVKVVALQAEGDRGLRHQAVLEDIAEDKGTTLAGVRPA